jgi:glycosyltransferase involved in cell wall biosynthesis
MIEGLRRAGAEVIECHEPLWRDIEDRVVAASGGWLHPAFIGRALRTYARLLWKYRTVSEYDVMVVGYPGQLDAFPARLLSWLRKRPLVMDAFMSIYLVAWERELVKRHPLTGRLIHLLEKAALHLTDRLIVMSEEYATWFGQMYGVAPVRCRLVLTGADDRIYRPSGGAPDPAYFTLIYYGTFIHTHGVLTVIEAARLLTDEPDVRFVLIGRGPVKEEAIRRVEYYGLQNVKFVDWVEQEEIPHWVAKADACLGVFGTTPQVQITIQNKIYEGLAMGKPVLTGDASTVRRWLQHGRHVYLCEPANPQALAAAIRQLRDDPMLRENLGHEGRTLFLTSFTPTALGALYLQYLQELVREASQK